jgi:hypothetical protein
MSSKKQTRSLHGNKTEPHSDLSHHYREIGIKAVAAAARKEHSAARRRGAAAERETNGRARKKPHE